MPQDSLSYSEHIGGCSGNPFYPVSKILFCSYFLFDNVTGIAPSNVSGNVSNPLEINLAYYSSFDNTPFGFL